MFKNVIFWYNNWIMKHLSRNDFNIQETKPLLWIEMSVNGEDGLAQAENTENVEKTLDSILDNPLRMGLDDVRKLSTTYNEELKQPKYRRKFQNALRYFLTLIDPEKESGSAFMILHFIAGEKKLGLFINRDIRDAIDKLTDKRLRRLAKLSSSSFDAWSDGETLEICRLYKALSKQAYAVGKKSENKQLNNLFDKVSDQLKQVRIGYLRQTNVSDLEQGVKALKNKQKLIVLQINTLFPFESEFVSPTKKNGQNEAYAKEAFGEDYKTKFSTLTNELLRQLLDGDLLENDPEMLPYWEHVQDILTDEASSQRGKAALGITDPRELPRLQQAVERRRGLQLLEVLKNGGSKGEILLPPHRHALVHLLHQKENRKSLLRNQNSRFEDYSQDQKNLQNQVLRTKAERFGITCEKINDMYQNIASVTGTTTTSSDFVNAQATLVEKRALLVSASESFQRTPSSPYYGNLDTYKNTFGTDFLYDPDVLGEYISSINDEGAEFRRGQLDRYQKAYVEYEKDLISAWEAYVTDSTQQAEKQAHEGKEEEVKKRIERQQDIINTQRAEFHDVEEQVNGLQTFDEDVNKTLKHHEEALKNRMQSKQMHAADFEVLFDDQRLRGSDDNNLTAQNILYRTEYSLFDEKTSDTLEQKQVREQFLEQAKIIMALRNRVQKVLEKNVIKKVVAEALNSNSYDLDKSLVDINRGLQPFILKRSLDDKLLKEMKEELPDAEVIDEFLQAIVQDVQEDIFNVLKGKLGWRKKGKVLDAWSGVRTHRNAQNPAELNTLSKTPQERIEQKKYDEGLFQSAAQDLYALFAHEGAEIPAVLRKDIDAAHEVLMNGERGKPGSLGKDQLYTIQAAASDIFQACDQDVAAFESLIGEFNHARNEGDEDKCKKIYASIQQRWDKGQFDRFVNYLEKECLQLDGYNPLPPFLKEYFKVLRHQVGTLDQCMQKPFGLDTMHTFKHTLNLFHHHFSWKTGGFAKQIKDKEQALIKRHISSRECDIGNYSQGVRLLKRHGMFEGGDEDEIFKNKNKGIFSKEAKKRFVDQWNERAKNDDVYKNYNLYLERIKKVEGYLRKDLKKYGGITGLKTITLPAGIQNGEKMFEQKYGFGFTHAQELLDEYVQSYTDVNTRWKTFRDPHFASQWVDAYNSADPKERAKHVADLSDWDRILDTFEEVGNKADEFAEFINDYDENSSEYSRRGIMWRSVKEHFGDVQCFSVNDIIATWKKFWESREVIKKRESDQMVASIGQYLTWGTVRQEFRRMGEDSEEQRVNEYKGNYGDLEMYNVKKRLYDTNDQDEARACIDLLNEDGRLQWGDPMLWRTLMRLGGGVTFNIPEDKDTKDLAEIREKVKIACSAIWSEKVFKEWDTNIKGNIEKQLAQFEGEFDLKEKMGISVKDTLSDMLQKWARGDIDDDDINPAKYEAFLRHAFLKGKLNGNPDSRIYFLIMGVSLRNPNGQTLLDPDIFNRFQDLMNNYPYIEFFIDSRSHKKNGRIYHEKREGTSDGVWKQADFDEWVKMLGNAGGSYKPDEEHTSVRIRNFFNEIMLQSKDARTRMGRKAQEGEFDHDDGFAFAAGFTALDVAAALTTQSHGARKGTYDFWLNWLVGANQSLRAKHDYIKRMDEEYATEEWWQEQRKEILLDAGENMRAAFVATQTLWGNGTINEGSVRAMEFEPKHILEGGGYNVQAAGKSKGALNVALSSLFEQKQDGEHGTDEDDMKLLDFDKRDPDKSNWDEKFTSTKSTGTDKESKDDAGKIARQNLLVQLAKGDKSKIFQDTDAIWNALEDYTKNVNISSDGYGFEAKGNSFGGSGAMAA